MMTLEEAIRHCEDVANDKCGCAEDCVSEHRQLAEWLKELQCYQWIPIGERLPEEREWIGTKIFGTTISDEVLVTFESRGERFVSPIHFQNGELGGMDKHTMDAVHGEWKAVAWMPLPQPWKGADDE